jgi:hypothetical protein
MEEFVEIENGLLVFENLGRHIARGSRGGNSPKITTVHDW